MSEVHQTLSNPASNAAANQISNPALNPAGISPVIAYYQAIGQVFGPSGRESAVREAIMQQIQADIPEGMDEITTDTLGNLICRMGRKQGDGKRLLFAAHMDSIGVVATYIDEKGFIRFAPVGGLEVCDLIHRPVRFANGTRAVIAREEKTPWKELTLDHLFLDIGAADKAQAASLVQIGDFAVFDAPTFAQKGILCGSYIDNRMGCVALLLAMKQIHEARTSGTLAEREAERQAAASNEYVFVFTVQEEVGLRGAGAAAFAIQPDIALAVDVTDTGDLPEQKNPMAIALGKGPAIKIMDRSVICSPSVCEGLTQTAQRLGIPVQREILLCGGTDTAALQQTRTGILSGAISIPARYIHSPSEMCAIADVENAARLLAQFAQEV